MPRHVIQIGLERCVAERPAVLDGTRFGLLMNQASVDSNLRYACDVLAEAYSGQLAAIFSPQHGLWGEQQANMVESPHGRYAPLGVPVYSLYADSRLPTPEMLAGLDCFVIDLQDVGTRVYTFAWTAAHCLEACAAAGVRVLVLDRPNPLGGQLVEGPLLEPAFRSFVGMAEIPMRHGLTFAELVRLLNDELAVGADVHVVPMSGWQRGLLFDELGRTWVPPSPNLPRVESVGIYPGQVLLEGTNLSEGRGTTLPFELCGAPYVNPYRLLNTLGPFNLPGVRLRPVRFLPTFDKWRGESCGGLALHVTDRHAFRPYRTTLAVLAACRQLWPNEFRWLPPPYEYETEKLPIDVISGGTRLRTLIDGWDGLDVDRVRRAAHVDYAEWSRRVGPYLLYERGA